MTGAVLRVEGAVITGAVGVVPVKVLEAQSVGIIRHQLVVVRFIADIQTGHLRGGQGRAVAAVLQLVIVNVGYVSDLLVVDISGVIGIVDGDEGRGILNIYKVIFVCTVVDGQIISTVVVIIVGIISSVIVVVSGIIIVPGLEIRAIGIVVAIGGVLIQEV